MSSRGCSPFVRSSALTRGSCFSTILSTLLGAVLLSSTAAAQGVPGQNAAAPAPGAAAPAPPGASPSAETAASAGTAASAETAASTEAAEHYDRGLKLHAEGDFALAAIEFERAYELVPDFRALYNIGQVRLQLAHYAKAKRALTQYLALGGAQISDERRQAVAADLEMLAGRTGTLNLTVNVAGAEITIDDTVVGKSPLPESLLLDAGEHRIGVRKPGFQAKSTQLTLVGGDARETRIDLEKTAVESQQIIIEREVADSNQDAWMWGMWTATGVLAVASGITAGLGVKAANDLDDKRGELGATRSELDSASRRARTLLFTGDLLGGLAIAAGGTAMYFTITRDDTESKDGPPAAQPKSQSAQLGLLVSPTAVTFVGSY